ncbi:MAG: hypothetical protein ACD_22C00015G0002 [uncultured bacterium]|nr:MAG: hypothetical protein ACD_22C00015G0002 [uncultured bacterium]
MLTQTGSKLTGAKIKFKDKAEEEIFKTVAIAQVGKYNSFETSFTLNPRDAVEVTLYYDLPATTTLSADSMAYTLYWQKQPGTQDDNFEFIFGSPFGLQSNVDKLSGVLSKDQSISVTLKPL